MNIDYTKYSTDFSLSVIRPYIEQNKKIDEYVTGYIHEFPRALIVNLGCGMDTRFSRLDNGSIHWYDLDLPPVIDFRKRFFTEDSRYHMISSSALTFQWFNDLEKAAMDHILFIAEGMLMYLYEEEVKALLLKLCSTFQNSRLICELAYKRWVKKMQDPEQRLDLQKQHYLYRTRN